MPASSDPTCPTKSHTPASRLWSVWGGLLATFLVVSGPLFVCMPVNSDVALFDVQAAEVLQGGTLYRDIVEPNLPGIVWIHLLIRSLAGWSSEAIRLVDLIVFAGLTVLLAPLISNRRGRAAFCCLAVLFYVSCNEWCHCQRDTWMLLPAAAATRLRFWRIQNVKNLSTGGLRAAAVAEGVCWGAAFWIKPHVAIPAGFIILSGWFLQRQQRGADVASVIAGGILAGLPGIAWLISSGTWPHFWDMMLNWNPEYLEAGRSRQSPDRWLMMFYRFHPWWCVHLVALPLSAATLRKALTAETVRGQDRDHRSAILLAGLYIGWLIQSLLLQHAMDYIHVPAMVLGLLLIAQHRWNLDHSLRRMVVGAFVLLAILASPILKPERVAWWPRCFTEGSSHEVRAVLAHGNFPAWQDLQKISEYLQAQNVRDGQLTCQNVHSVHLFRELQIQPATRFWSVGILQELFPGRADAIERAVWESPTRFVVTESGESKLADGPLPNRFPWNLPVVFQSGTYRVHAMPDTIVNDIGATASR